MKKIVVSLFVLLVLGGLVLLYKARATSIVEIALDKKQVLTNSQLFDAPGIPEYIVKRFDGKQAFLMEQLDNTLDNVQDLLTEIRTAFVERKVKGAYNAYAGGTNATLKTPTAEIRLTWISNDGTYRQCTKITYSDGKELKKEEMVFYSDNKTLKYYEESGRLLYFKEDGNLEWFSLLIDDKKYEIGWNAAGEIELYTVDDIRPQNPSDKI